MVHEAASSPINRRSFLRGTEVTLALPLMESLLPDSAMTVERASRAQRMATISLVSPPRPRHPTLMFPSPTHAANSPSGKCMPNIARLNPATTVTRKSIPSDSLWKTSTQSDPGEPLTKMVIRWTRPEKRQPERTSKTLPGSRRS